MRRSIQLGKLHGIPVGLHWSTVVILFLLTYGLAGYELPAAVGGHPASGYWLAASGFASLFLAALLAHEYAHARAAQHYGIRVRSITLWLLGGVSELDGEPPHPRAELLITVAGPAASIAAAGVFLALAESAATAGLTLLTVGFGWLAIVNGVLAVFNLLPGAPLDGGRVLAAILWKVRGDRAAAHRSAARAGATIGVVIALTGLAMSLSRGTIGGLWLVLLGWYLAASARLEGSALRLAGVADLPAGRLMSAPAVCGYRGHDVAGFVASVAEARPHRCYPVVDLDGRLTGLVLMDTLGRVPPEQRPDVRLGEVMVPAARIRTAQRDTLMSDPSTMPTDPLRLTVILDGDRPCGVLTGGDLSRALGVVAAGGRPHRGLRLEA